MGSRPKEALWRGLVQLEPQPGASLQFQIRRMLVSAILERHFPAETPLPSGRELAEHLSVARNTVVLAYEQLVSERYLVARERRGYFVNPDILAGRTEQVVGHATASTVNWSRRLRRHWSEVRQIVKPADWQRYPYPFIYGQFDSTLFPLAEWRECNRLALGALQIGGWAGDLIDRDDPTLIEQLQTRVLPRRGVFAAPEEIMVTIGAQQALYLLAEMFSRDDLRVGIEDPGYTDARNIFATKADAVIGFPVDDGGLIVSDALAACSLVYFTPSHQCPTTVTMPLGRRIELLALAEHHDIVLIEDDYEPQFSFDERPMPALKSLDRTGRVIYVGSLSKTLAPGLRLGFVVAPAELLREARALRRMMLRHPPANNQRCAALFLALGHHDALVRRLMHALKQRAAVLEEALVRHIPHFMHHPVRGGSAVWVTGPETLDASTLVRAAALRGVLIESGDVFFSGNTPPRNYFRLGFSSIPSDRIETGVRELAAALRDCDLR